MSRKKDPIHLVLDFFENGGLETVQTLLSILQAIVKKRTPFKAPERKTRQRRSSKPKTPTPAPTPAPLAAVEPSTPAAPKTPARRRSRAKAAAAAPPTPAAAPATGEQDLALPGLGPATVGEE